MSTKSTSSIGYQKIISDFSSSAETNENNAIQA